MEIINGHIKSVHKDSDHMRMERLTQMNKAGENKDSLKKRVLVVESAASFVKQIQSQKITKNNTTVVQLLRRKCGSYASIAGLRQHRIQNTSSDFKHTQRPCLVQTEALFDEDEYLSLQEWASVWMIRRLCLATRRPCLLTHPCCIVFDENTKTQFLNVSNRYLCP